LKRDRVVLKRLQKEDEKEAKALMPVVEIDLSERIPRHLAAVRLMSYMVYPDDMKLGSCRDD